MKWTMRDGTKIDIKDMSTSHLRNAIAMCRRKGYCTFEEFQAHFSYMPQGEMAQDAWESEAANLKPIKGLEKMERELARRSL